MFFRKAPWQWAVAFLPLVLVSQSALAGGGIAPGMPAGPPAVARASTVAVECDAGGQLQTALDEARPGDTIIVTGRCAENVTINEEVARLTLDGQGTATIDGPNPGVSVITVLGRGITIRGFTIVGGTNGIAVWRGGTAVIDSNTISGGTRAGTGGQGINVAQHSYAQIVSNTIEGNSNAGITVIEGSSARIGVVNPTVPQGNVIRRNGANGGVYVSGSSSARIGVNTISDNAGPGVFVTGASQAVVSSNHLDGNGANGVTVTQNSSLWLGGDLGALAEPNDTMAPNKGFGISCALNSSAVGRLGTLAGESGPRDFDQTCSNMVAP